MELPADDWQRIGLLASTLRTDDLDHFDKPFVRHADLALPVRDTDSAILVYGYSWLL